MVDFLLSQAVSAAGVLRIQICCDYGSFGKLGEASTLGGQSHRCARAGHMGRLVPTLGSFPDTGGRPAIAARCGLKRQEIENIFDNVLHGKPSNESAIARGFKRLFGTQMKRDDQ
jgi:hypothetical protein